MLRPVASVRKMPSGAVSASTRNGSSALAASARAWGSGITMADSLGQHPGRTSLRRSRDVARVPALPQGDAMSRFPRAACALLLTLLATLPARADIVSDWAEATPKVLAKSPRSQLLHTTLLTDLAMFNALN